MRSSAPAPGRDATPADVDAFLRRFARFGAEASVETYHALFDPGVRLFDDGMERPIGYDEIPAHIAGVLGLVKGFRMTIERWRARENVVFVEAHNGGEIAGTPVGWRAVYRIELAGGLVVDGRRYFDRAPLLARLGASAAAPAGASASGPGTSAGHRVETPAARADAPATLSDAVAPRELPVAALVSQLAAVWREGDFDALAEPFREDATLAAPGLARPLARAEIPAWARELAGRMRGTPRAVRRWAGDDALLFVEWALGGGGSPAAPHPGIVERFDLVAGRVLAARAYHDSAAIERFCAARP